MAKLQIKPNPRVQAIFDDLDKFLRFCQDFGYKYNEAARLSSYPRRCCTADA